MRNFKIILLIIFTFFLELNSKGQSDGFEKVNQVISNDILNMIFNNKVQDLKKYCLFNQNVEIELEDIDYIENQYIIYLNNSKWHIKALIVADFLEGVPEAVWKFYIAWTNERDKNQFLQYFPELANFTYSDGVYYRSTQTLKVLGPKSVEFWLYYPPLELKNKAE